MSDYFCNISKSRFLHTLKWAVVRLKAFKTISNNTVPKYKQKKGKTDPHTERANWTASHVSWFRGHGSKTKSKRGEFLFASYFPDATTKSLSVNDLNKSIWELIYSKNVYLYFKMCLICSYYKDQLSFYLTQTVPFLSAQVAKIKN